MDNKKIITNIGKIPISELNRGLPIIESLFKIKDSNERKYRLVLYNKEGMKVDSSILMSGRDMWENWEYDMTLLMGGKLERILLGATIAIETEETK